MANPFETSRSSITSNGNKTAVELAVPRSGHIQRIVVNQSAGTLSGYTVELYSSATRAGSNLTEGYDIDNDGGIGTQAVIGKVTPTLNIGVGVADEQVFDISYPYNNRDPKSNGRFIGKLHLIIDPTGAVGDEVFEITVAGEAAQID